MSIEITIRNHETGGTETIQTQLYCLQYLVPDGSGCIAAGDGTGTSKDMATLVCALDAARRNVLDSSPLVAEYLGRSTQTTIDLSAMTTEGLK